MRPRSPVSNLFLLLALAAPALSALAPFFLGRGVEGFNPVRDPIALLSVLNDGEVGLIYAFGMFLLGGARLAFAFGLAMRVGWLSFSALFALGLAATSFAAGLFTPDSAYFDLYGLSIVAVLLPAAFATEVGLGRGVFAQLCIGASAVQLAHVWAIVFGFEPIAISGAIRMLATLALDLWIAGAAVWLMARDDFHPPEPIRTRTRRRKSSSSGRRRRA